MKIIYSILFICVSLWSCKSDKVSKTNHAAYQKISGQTMGTTYNLIYENLNKDINKDLIDSILIEINLSLSTYIDSSTISRINNSEKFGEKINLIKDDDSVSYYKISLDRDEHFLSNYQAAYRIYKETKGAFDPTVMPLVNYWGFGYDPKKPVTTIDSLKIGAILKYVGFDKFSLEYDSTKMTIVKPDNAELDFSAIAKGYAVDYLATELANRKINNMMVEIGGEVFSQGFSPSAEQWKVGLTTPHESSSLSDYSAIVKLDKQGLASSGNYRNYHVVNGKRYGHEINPMSGYPEKNSLLGVSVLAPSCMEADAMATALMIMGYNKAKTFVTSHPQLEAGFFTSDSLGRIKSDMTEGFTQYLVDKTD